MNGMEWCGWQRPATEPDRLSLAPGIHMVEGEKQPLQVVSLLIFTYVVEHAFLLNR